MMGLGARWGWVEMERWLISPPLREFCGSCGGGWLFQVEIRVTESVN
ncbi:hypothetical protein HanXRQr2_Chr06g0247181 [Helianthus annuus]|uniref:Uncharacterized protein n=1 Tax=Helianthus annuus TaxID=4232 RepID=A0A9K3IQP7_HELAN|nr:hypothetical protein HanXRQr2_Chr06g0247181 [Helianthus annuus]